MNDQLNQSGQMSNSQDGCQTNSQRYDSFKTGPVRSAIPSNSRASCFLRLWDKDADSGRPRPKPLIFGETYEFLFSVMKEKPRIAYFSVSHSQIHSNFLLRWTNHRGRPMVINRDWIWQLSWTNQLSCHIRRLGNGVEIENGIRKWVTGCNIRPLTKIFAYY